MKILIWLLIAYGISNILVMGNIFLMMRVNVKKKADAGSRFFNFINGILGCMMCCSVWVGFFLGMFTWSPCAEFLEMSNIISWFFDGALASAAVCLISIFINHYKIYDGND